MSLPPEGTDRPWLFLQPYLVEYVMGNVLFLGLGNLICDDWEAFVHLHGVAIDDLAVETLR